MCVPEIILKLRVSSVVSDIISDDSVNKFVLSTAHVNIHIVVQGN